MLKAGHVSEKPFHFCRHLTDSLLAGFIRGLLENVGPEVDPIRLIRRIKNGLDIPGLKPAIIKILQDFNIQVRIFSMIVRDWCMSNISCAPPDITYRWMQNDPQHGLQTTHLGALRWSDQCNTWVIGCKYVLQMSQTCLQTPKRIKFVNGKRYYRRSYINTVSLPTHIPHNLRIARCRPP